MNGTRLVVWLIGVALVVVAMFLLFFETGVASYVPVGIALAGLLLIVGVIVMGMSEKMRGETTHHHESPPREHIIHEGHRDTEPRRETRIIERGHD